MGQGAPAKRLRRNQGPSRGPSFAVGNVVGEPPCYAWVKPGSSGGSVSCPFPPCQQGFLPRGVPQSWLEVRGARASGAIGLRECRFVSPCAGTVSKPSLTAYHVLAERLQTHEAGGPVSDFPLSCATGGFLVVRVPSTL